MRTVVTLYIICNKIKISKITLSYHPFYRLSKNIMYVSTYIYTYSYVCTYNCIYALSPEMRCHIQTLTSITTTTLLNMLSGHC